MYRYTIEGSYDIFLHYFEANCNFLPWKLFLFIWRNKFSILKIWSYIARLWYEISHSILYLKRPRITFFNHLTFWNFLDLGPPTLKRDLEDKCNTYQFNQQIKMKIYIIWPIREYAVVIIISLCVFMLAWGIVLPLDRQQWMTVQYLIIYVNNICTINILKY